jgi:N-methylhydantoinase A/oxoprolinase/acetone carboxylase beta subunit
MNRIGIDVGGTNTDAVLLRGTTILASVKTPTTADVTTGITKALAEVLAQSEASRDAIDAVMIGTTHFTNAVVQRRGLTRVGAIRICLPTCASLEPFIDWPEDLRNEVRATSVLLAGGHEVDGRPITTLDEDGLRAAARELRREGVTEVAVTAVFSPMTAECEERAAGILQEVAPDLSVTLSHRLGRIGLLERENVALLNACLRDLAQKTTSAFIRAIAECGIEAPLYMTRNDGTVMRSELAERFPVWCFASGPTNSMRGAAFLSGLSDAVVIDVGGTTTDIGMLKNGFPREANSVIEIGGVRTLFRMPDLLSLALGGGTLVTGEPLAIGPESVGYELTTRALVFGGNELTMTDLAVAAGLADIGEPRHVAHLDTALIEAVLDRVRVRITGAVDRIKTSAGDLPLIVVGGGGFLVPESISGTASVVHVSHGEVANAVGAAIAQISGETDQVFRDLPREEAIAEARRIAEALAVEAGADPATLEVVEIEDLPLAYMPGNSLRARVRVVGDVGR